jgi:hypothetical protein
MAAPTTSAHDEAEDLLRELRKSDWAVTEAIAALIAAADFPTLAVVYEALDRMQRSIMDCQDARNKSTACTYGICFGYTGKFPTVYAVHKLVLPLLTYVLDAMMEPTRKGFPSKLEKYAALSAPAALSEITRTLLRDVKIHELNNWSG